MDTEQQNFLFVVMIVATAAAWIAWGFWASVVVECQQIILLGIAHYLALIAGKLGVESSGGTSTPT